MFGLFKKKENYPDLSDKYHAILRRDFNMKSNYVNIFIKKRGDELSLSEYRVRKANKGPNVSSTIKMTINKYGYEHFILNTVCWGIYMQELKNGKDISNEEELVAVSMLMKLRDVNSQLDPRFANWLEANKDTNWPGIFETVFNQN